MRLMSLLTCLACAVSAAPAGAQVTGPGLPPAQLLDAQRRAELRQQLAQKQAADAHEMRLNLQQRAELRDAVRKQRQGAAGKDAGAGR